MMVIVMFVQSLLLRELKISEVTFTLSRRKPLSYRNQSIDLRSKSMDLFLYDNGLRLERVKNTSIVKSTPINRSDKDTIVIDWIKS